MRRPVFLSFHYKRDVSRVQQVRNIGSIDEQPLLSPQEWEQVKRGGDKAVEQWIARQMRYKQAVVVLIGQETAARSWVQYEIRKAHEDGRPLLGVYIHGLAGFNGPDRKGADPFTKLGLPGIPTVDPTGITSKATYANILTGLPSWIEDAVLRHKVA